MSILLAISLAIAATLALIISGAYNATATRAALNHAAFCLDFYHDLQASEARRDAASWDRMVAEYLAAYSPVDTGDRAVASIGPVASWTAHSAYNAARAYRACKGNPSGCGRGARGRWTRVAVCETVNQTEMIARGEAAACPVREMIMWAKEYGIAAAKQAIELADRAGWVAGDEAREEYLASVLGMIKGYAGDANATMIQI